MLINNRPGSGIGPQPALTAATTVGAGLTFTLNYPCRDWGIQVVTGSTSAVVTLQLGIASTGTLTTAVTWASSDGRTTGQTVFSPAAYPACAFAVVLSAGASSNGCSAWVAGL